jgi:beta-phosphoglucomutase
MRTQAVIFDMDGVLVDSYRAHLEAWQRLASRLGRTLTEERFAACFGRRNPDMMRALWGDAVPDRRLGELADWKEVQYREILRENFPAMDGAAELVQALRSAGFRVGVGSSGPPENIVVAVEGLGGAHLFDVTVNGAEVRAGKPDPEVFLKAAAKLGTEPHDCAVIEDAVAGIEAARRAGMTAVALAGTAGREALEAAGAHLVVDSLRDLSPHRIAALIRNRRD